MLFCFACAFVEAAKGTCNQWLEKLYGEFYLPTLPSLRLAEAMTKLAISVYQRENAFHTFSDFHLWEIVEPRGIPNHGQSGNSGLWVAEWMNIQNSFNNQIIGVMDEYVARIKIVMMILMGPNNECKELIMKAANECWLQLHINRDKTMNMKRQRTKGPENEVQMN
ncbi:hypothetical protein TSUD_393110 [Trifolium subterraneum]|uniref:Uncharacterized protein n=1 Tax=Trifolium subterraneum TaxID=3900 RepID=A0A2Z6N9G4_TRISU|nr:hypothetical protein TSUD_393110 [Trifolium subterraneum]